jgi:hypothetical protein
MLVLAIAEGNGAAPANVNHRVAIAPSTAAPVLAVQCTSGDRTLARPDLDAGQTLKLRCAIENTGNALTQQEYDLYDAELINCLK